MTALSAALTEFSTNGDSRTYTTLGHTVQKAKVVVNKRKVPVGNQTVSEFTVSVVHATETSAGDVLPQKLNFTVSIRQPIDGLSSDRDAALVLIRDIIASDEFANSVATSEFLA